MIRNCSDSYFSGRTRPCLQYHIKRCTAPCAGKVGEEDYAIQVDEAKAFLSGKSQAIQEKLAAAMQQASERQDYEAAAQLRDRLRALTAVQARQIVNDEGLKDADVIALCRQGENSCVQVFFFRGGQNYGNHAYHMKHGFDVPPDGIVATFISQFYEDKTPPPEILVSHAPEELSLIEAALGSAAGRGVRIAAPLRGVRHELVKFALNNAREALEREVAGKYENKVTLERLAEIFGLDEAPGRIEIYDNSHISGANMVAAMVVAGPEGFIKNAYRKFNIRKAGAADDYGMMREVMERRFGRALKDDPDRQNGDWPDLVLLDGGKGQLGAALEVLEYIGITDKLNIAAIAKGPDRNAGRETFFLPGREGFQLQPNDPVLFYLQSLRDEAHRFAIGAHRARRNRDISRSPLDEVPGIGPKRKKALLMHFGSGKAVADAALKDLQKVSGISQVTAESIYNFFHNN